MAGEEKKLDEQTITIRIKLPTKQDVVNALSKLFPGLEVIVEVEEKPGEPVAEESQRE